MCVCVCACLFIEFNLNAEESMVLQTVEKLLNLVPVAQAESCHGPSNSNGPTAAI